MVHNDGEQDICKKEINVLVPAENENSICKQVKLHARCDPGTFKCETDLLLLRTWVAVVWFLEGWSTSNGNMHHNCSYEIKISCYNKSGGINFRINSSQLICSLIIFPSRNLWNHRNCMQSEISRKLAECCPKHNTRMSRRQHERRKLEHEWLNKIKI